MTAMTTATTIITVAPCACQKVSGVGAYDALFVALVAASGEVPGAGVGQPPPGSGAPYAHILPLLTALFIICPTEPPRAMISPASSGPAYLPYE